MPLEIDGKCNGVFMCGKCLKDVDGCPFDYRDAKGDVIGPCCSKNKSKEK